MTGLGRKTAVRLDAGALILLSAALLVVPVRWLIAWCIAALFHELCHYAMLRILGVQVLRVQIGLLGARLHTDFMLPHKEILCSIAGPLGGFALTITARQFPYVAICGVLQSLYNLLPLYPLDGGRVLRAAVIWCVGIERGEAIMVRLTAGLYILLLCFGIYNAIVLRMGLFLPAVLILAGIKVGYIKIPCKRHKHIVQ